MKAYTLRLDDGVLDALKHIGIKEKKTVREIMLECIAKRISHSLSENESLKEQREMEKPPNFFLDCPRKKWLNPFAKNVKNEDF
jgi:hypothetical protein